MSDKTKHEGIIMAKTASSVHVRIVESAACGDCKAHAYCNSSEKKEKYVDAILSPSSSHTYNVGDRVAVEGSISMGMKAVWLGFGVPLLLLVAGIVIGAKLIHNEGGGALMGLGVLVPYYLLLWALRPRLNKEFVFRVV